MIELSRHKEVTHESTGHRWTPPRRFADCCRAQPPSVSGRTPKAHQYNQLHVTITAPDEVPPTFVWESGKIPRVPLKPRLSQEYHRNGYLLSCYPTLLFLFASLGASFISA